MANLMQVNFVDSESQIFTGEAEYLVVSAFDGEIGIFPHHTPLISKLVPGILRIKQPNKDEQLVFAISGGFIEVCDNRVIVLADIVERTEELDEKRLIEQKQDALQKLKRADSISTAEVAKAQAALEIAVAQLKAFDFLGKKIKHR